MVSITPKNLPQMLLLTLLFQGYETNLKIHCCWVSSLAFISVGEFLFPLVSPHLLRLLAVDEVTFLTACKAGVLSAPYRS